MNRKAPVISEYKTVWLIAMFDLPVKTKEKRKQYAQFRNTLLKHGFSMLQYSVYARFFSSEEASEAHRKQVHAAIPPEGQVRLLTITDRQFGKMEVFYGKKRKSAEEKPEQLSFF